MDERAGTSEQAAAAGSTAPVAGPRPDREGLIGGDRPWGPFVDRTLTVLGLTALGVALALLVWNAGDILLLAFASVILAVFLSVPAGFLTERTGMPRPLAVVLTVLVLIGLLVGAGFIVGPQLSAQVTELLDQLPSTFSELRERVEANPVGGWLLERLPEGGASLPSGAGIVSRVTGTAAMLGDAATKVVFVVFFGLFLAIAPDRYRSGIAQLFPRSKRPRVQEAMARSGTALRGWLLGQLIAMTAVGALTWLGLSLIGVPLGLALGLVAGLAEFVPMIGPLVGLLPAALLALSQGTTQLLLVVGLFLLIQQLVSNILVPIVQKRTIDMPPALTIAAVFVGAAAFGPVGMLVATPLLAVVIVLVKMLYVRDVLGDEVDLPDAG